MRFLTKGTVLSPLKTMNQVSQVNMAPAIHGPCNSTVSRSWALSRTAPRNTRITMNDTSRLTAIDTTMPPATSPTFGHWTFSKPARKSEAPTSSKTRQAVVLTGMPKPEKPYSSTVSTK